MYERKTSKFCLNFFKVMQFDIDNFLTAIASCTDCNVAASLAFLYTRGFFLRHALLT